MSSLLWHLSFHLIPRGSDGRIEINPGVAQTIGNAELMPCWREREGYDFGSVFDRALPRSAGRSAVIEQWGSEEDINVEVWRLPQGISVYVRIHIVGSTAESLERL